MGACVRRVCDGIQEEEDSKGGMDGKERDTRGKCQDLSPCLVFIRAQEARARTGSSKEPGWALGTPDQEAQRCRGGCSYTVLVSVLGCFEPVACLLSDREVVAVTLPCLDLLASPPITMLLLLIIKHPPGFPAARSCT